MKKTFARRRKGPLDTSLQADQGIDAVQQPHAICDDTATGQPRAWMSRKGRCARCSILVPSCPRGQNSRVAAAEKAAQQRLDELRRMMAEMKVHFQEVLP